MWDVPLQRAKALKGVEVLKSPALLRVGVLSVEGTVRDVGAGGLFLSSHVLVEAGEHGQLELPGLAPVRVRMVWTRGSQHPLGQGLGMAFEARDLEEERRVLELVLALVGADEA